jgi:hypothetical protein
MSVSPKGPVAVIVISNGTEVISFANQVRSLLNEAGYADPDRKEVEGSLASYTSSNPASSTLVCSVNTTAQFGLPIQKAFQAIGIPADGTTDTKNVLNLKPGELAIVITSK